MGSCLISLKLNRTSNVQILRNVLSFFCPFISIKKYTNGMGNTYLYRLQYRWIGQALFNFCLCEFNCSIPV